MASITITPKLQDLINQILADSNTSLTKTDKDGLTIDLTNNQLTFNNIKLIQQYLHDNNTTTPTDTITNHVLLDYFKNTNSEIKLIQENEVSKPENAEQMKRREYLQLQKERKAYNNMIYGTDKYNNYCTVYNINNNYKLLIVLIL